MENGIKRFLSLAMALIMVIGMMPLSVFATDGSLGADDGSDTVVADTDFTDATADESGEGWAWANESKTLTLNGAAITTAVTLPADSTIVVTAGTENSVKVESGNAVSSDGKLAISGTGKLAVIADDTNGVSAVVAPAVSITDTVVDLHGYYYGIQAKTTSGNADSVVTLTNVSGKIVGYGYGGINAHSETANVVVKLNNCHDLVINNEVTNDSTSVNFNFAGIRAYTRGNGKDVLVELNGCEDISISNSTMAILAANNANAANEEAANVKVLIKDSTGIELTGNTSCYSAVFVNNYGVENDDSSNLVIENSTLEVNAPNGSGLMTSTKSAPSEVGVTGSDVTITAGLTGIRIIASSADYADTNVTGSDITFKGDLKGSPVDVSAGGTVVADEDYADDASTITVVKPATTYEVSTKAELDAAIAAAQDGDTIKLTADIESNAVLVITKAITLDLGGFKLTTTNGWGGLQLKNGCSVKNGTLLHTGRVNAIKVWDVVSLEDLVIEVTDTTEGKTVGGIAIQENAAGVDSIKNVTLKGEGLDYGIETYNCGNAQVIGSMENVTIDAVGTGMLLSAPCGTATNCTIKGGVSGIDMLLKGTYSVSLNLVNCKVEGGKQAVYAHDEQKGYTYVGSLVLTADEATTFESTSGVLLTELTEEDTNVTLPAVLVEGAVAKANGAYYKTFKEAVAAANAVEGGATVTLLQDVTLGEKLTISGNVTISGAYTITRDDAYTGTLFTVNAGATLTLDGGLTIDGGNNYGFNSELYNADLEAMVSIPATDANKYFTPEEGAPVATAYMIVLTKGTSADAFGGTVNLNNVTIQNNYSINSGIVSAAQYTETNLNGAKITHVAATQASGVVVNASGAGIKVNMNEGTVIDGNHVGGNHGIFKIYSGTVFTMDGGEVKNTTGWNSNGNVVGLYGGTFIMNGGTICSNSSVYGPANGRNAAIYLHSNSVMEMNGGTICHNTGRSRGGIDSSKTSSKLTITGGKVLDNISLAGNSTADIGGTVGTWEITGGTFTQDVSAWLAPNIGLAYDETTGTYGITERVWEMHLTDANGEAHWLSPMYGNDLAGIISSSKIWYDSLQGTYSFTLKLLTDVKIDATAVVDFPLTIDLNGKTITTVEGVVPAIRITNGADVTVKNGTMNTGSYCFILGASDGSSAGNLTIESGKYHGVTSVASVTKGTLTVLGGEFSVEPYNGSYEFLLNCIDANYKDGSAQIVVKGGSFTGFNPANNAAEGTGTNFVAEGYLSESKGDVYTVRQNKDTMEAVVTITFDDSNSGTQMTLKYPSERYDSIQKLIGTNSYDDFVIGATQSELLAYIAQGRASNIVMTLHDDIELDAPINFYNEYFQIAAEYGITINGNSHTITWADGYTGTLINVESGVSVTTKNLTIDGENAFTFYDDTTAVENGQNWYTRFVNVGEEDKAVNANVIVNAGNLTLGEGTVIQNVTIATDHADGKTENTEKGYILKYNQDLAIIKSNGGTVALDGAKINGNAGIVLHADNAASTITNATITGNMGCGREGGILQLDGGSATISNSHIDGNKAMARCATILAATSGAVVTFENSTIDNNTQIGVGSNTAGSMVVVREGSKFVMNGGSISNNAGGRAGAIASRWATKDASIELNAGTITGNTASNDGWGNASIFLRSPATIGEGMTIDGNIVVNASPAELDITGGNFTGSLTVTDGLSAEISGGTFNYDPTEWLAEGYVAPKNEDGTYSVRKQTYVEWVQEQLFAGNSVTLTEDIVITDYDLVHAHAWPSNGNGKHDERHGNGAIFHVIKPGVVLDLNGHSIIWDAHHDDYCNKRQVSLFMVTITGNPGETADLTVKDSGNTGKVEIYGMGTGMYVVGVDAAGTIEGGTWTNYPCKTCSASNIFFYPSHGGKLYITGGTFEQKDSEYLLGWMGSTKETTNNGVGVDYDETEVIITGGTFVGFNPAEVKFFDYANGSQESEANGCAPTYVPVDNGDGTYGVELWNGETISNKYELQAFADKAAAGETFSGKTVKLIADIDFEWAEWTAVNFAGTFEGNNHTIKNLTYVPTGNGRMGFFQSISGPAKDLTLDGIKGTVPADGRFGGFARYLNAAVENIHVKNIEVTTTDTLAWVGGFTTYTAGGSTNNCSVENLTVNAQAGADLIAGFISLTANRQLYQNSTVNGFKVNVTDTHSSGCGVGGFVAQTQTGWNNPKFANCSVEGIDVTANGLVDVGGFVAWPGAHTAADNCTTEGKIDVTGVTSDGCFAGGFFGNLGWNADLGQMGHVVTNCSADVDITTKVATAGGFVSSATNSNNASMYATFTNCSAKGDITAVEGGTADIGGFFGDGDRGVYNFCTASGTVTNNGTGYSGTFGGALYDVTPKYDSRYPAGTRDYLVDEITLDNCTATGTATSGKFIGNVADGVKLTIQSYIAEVVETGVKYYTLTEALNACTNGETIKLIADIVYDADDVVYAHGGATGFGDYDQYNPSIVYIGGTRVDEVNSPSNVNAVLDLNGHTITNNANAYLFLIMDNAKLTFKDSADGGALISSTNTPVIWVAGTETLVTVESGKYTTASKDGLIWSTHGGDLVIKGGEFSTSADDASLLIMRNAHNRQNSAYFISGKATVTVTGGTFYGFNPEEMMDDSTTPFTQFNAVANGYKADENNGVWTVKPLITVTFDDFTMVAGNKLPEFTYTTNFTEIAEDGNMLVVEDPEVTVNGAGEYEITANAYVFLNDDYVVEVIPGTLTVTAAAAKIGDVHYATLAEAIAKVQDGETIVLLAENAENVTIKQTKDLSFTIDGANMTYTGTITIDGNKRSTGAETLTIQNVNFKSDTKSHIFIYALDGTNAHNVTVDNCSFTGVDKTAYGMKLANAYNIAIKNSTGSNLLELVYSNKAVTGFIAENCTVTDSVNGFYMSYPIKASFKGLDLDVSNTGVYVNNYNASTATIEDCTIKAANPVVLHQRNASKSYTLTFNGTNTFVTDGAWLTVDGTDAMLKVVLNDTGLDATKASGLVANIGNVYYNTLANAIKDAKDGDTVAITVSHVLDGAKTVTESSFGYETLIVLEGKAIILDLNGKTLEVTPDCADANGGIKGTLESVIFVRDGASLTIQDSSESQTGGFLVKKGTDLYSLIYNNGSTLTIESGNFHVEETIIAGSLIYADGISSQKTTINGGVFTLGNASADGSTTKPWIINVQGKNEGFVEITGGIFNQNPLMNYGTAKDCEVTIADNMYFVQITEGEYAGYYKLAEAVAVNVNTGKRYGDLSVALTEAKAGQTVKLVRDVEVFYLMVFNGITLDLNGFALTTNYLASFGDVVDNSDDNAGELIVPEGQVTIRTDNAQLPIKNAQGNYQFVAITKMNALVGLKDGVKMFGFQPLFEAYAHDLLRQGEEASGVTIRVRATWTTTEGKRSQDFVYVQEKVEGFIDSYNPATGKYSQMFSLVLKGVESIDDLMLQVVVVSDAGVECTSAQIAY